MSQKPIKKIKIKKKESKYKKTRCKNAVTKMINKAIVENYTKKLNK